MSSKVQFYNGVNLLSAKDINGNTPEIFVSDGNRSAGKTTFFNKWFVNRYKKYGEKFIILYRYKNELSDVETKFFKDIQRLFFKSDVMTSKKKEKGNYIELYLNDDLCGWALAINQSEKYKRLSHVFTECVRMLFDEFQTENGEYTVNEVKKFFKLHTTVARGEDQPVRYVPVYMVSNHVSSLNPYYKAWGVCSKCDDITNGIIKGKGFVIERSFNESVSKLQTESLFNSAFEGSDIYEHTVNNDSLFENRNFVEIIKSDCFKYICNIVCDGKMVAIKSPRDRADVDFYFTDKVDENVKNKVVFSSRDHDTTTIMQTNNSDLCRMVRQGYDFGRVRFSDVVTKDIAFKFMCLSIN